MDTFVRIIIDFFLKHNAINEEKRKIYEFGLQVMIGNIIEFAITFIAAAILGMIPQTALYYAAFIPLRKCAGGYHAATRMQCFIISTVTWLAAMVAIRTTAHLSHLTIGLTVLSCAAVFFFAPVEHKNNPMTAKKKTAMRRKSRNLACFISALVVVTTLLTITGLPNWVASSLALGMVLISGSLAYAAVTKLQRI